MDNNNWRPTPPGGEPNMETPDQLMGQSNVMLPGQQQLMLQIQSLPAQLQQQLGLQQQPNALQRDMQQRLQESSQSSGSVLQPQNVVDQQKQLYQSQRALPETSSTSLDSTTGQSNGGDWQEEVYQKIKVMKEMYFPELNEMYQKFATKLHQHDSLPQQPKSDQLEKLKIFRSMLERIIGFLQVSKINVQPSYKEKLGSYEKQIVNFINANRSRKPSMQQGQLPPPHMHSMQQPPQVQSHDNQMNPQMQSMNLQGSVATMQQNNMTSLQHNAISSISGVSTAPHNMLNSLQSGSNLYSGQGNTLNSLQQVAVGSLPQNSVTASQQANINTPSKQQLMGQQSLSSLHYQQLGSQSNVSGLQQQQQQQQLLGTKSENSNMPTNQHSEHILQQPKVPMQQQPQQSAPNLLSSQGSSHSHSQDSSS